LLMSRKLTEAEMEEKRAEMMRNAEQRDKQRLDNVKRYKAEDDREKRTLAQQSAAASFVKYISLTDILSYYHRNHIILVTS